MVKGRLKAVLKKQHYASIGEHSAVQICRWAKKSLRNEGFCYKEKFYGIKSHRCCQMSPNFAFCQNKCLHCWRAIELTEGKKFKGKTDEPKKIISDCIEAQRKLLSGFKGYKKVNLEKLKEAQNPNQFAISLIGEPTLYPRLAELILELRKQGKTSFLVTNGLNPERLFELKKKNALPTQLYISLNAENENLFRKITRNKDKQAWKRLNKSLGLMSKLSTRKVIRITLIKNLNMIEPEKYAKLILRANPDFVEVKGFMSIGFSRKRLGYERMPNHKEIKDFARNLLNFLPKYKFLDEQEFSRVVLLGKDRRKMKIKKREI